MQEIKEIATAGLFGLTFTLGVVVGFLAAVGLGVLKSLKNDDKEQSDN